MHTYLQIYVYLCIHQKHTHIKSHVVTLSACRFRQRHFCHFQHFICLPYQHPFSSHYFHQQQAFNRPLHSILAVKVLPHFACKHHMSDHYNSLSGQTPLRRGCSLSRTNFGCHLPAVNARSLVTYFIHCYCCNCYYN